jgi:feruloyl esterase
VRPAAFLAATLFLTGTLQAQTANDGACTALAQLKLPDTTVATADAVTGGSFTVPGSTNTISNLPPFCRVGGVVAPTAESQIRFEVWLPLAQWNGKLAGVGNGGWAGSIPYGALAEQLRRGYATAATNTGHESAPGQNMARFAFEKPEQLIDFAYRSHHETAVKAKALVQAFYAKPAARAYFIGCSSGGYEGFMAAQRFPADYDGIVAGMPANNWTRLMAGDLDATIASFKGGIANLPPAALGVLHRAAIAACDANDGVTDGAIENPLTCRVDPAALACTPGGASGSCLTAAQVEAARRIYDGLKDPKSGAQLYPGLAPGSEPFWVNRDPANPFAIPISHYKWLVFRDPDWDWKTFDFTDPADYDAHVEAEAKLAPIMNATDPNLSAFRERGGRLLQYHGWYDQLIAPANSINYFESVVAHFGGGKDREGALKDVQTFYRLFMMPAVAHCGGGTGPSAYDVQTALEDWVERDTAPDRIVASRLVGGVVDRTRPLCPYPQVAVYNGKGDTNDAANFTCRVAK